MSRRKGKRNPLIDSDAATIRLLCDEASNHMKVRNYTRALTTYNQVTTTKMFISHSTCD